MMRYKVTHADGTVSRRTSQSRVYTHAVVISRTRASLVAEALTRAADNDAQADAITAAIDGEITETVRDWSGGLSYHDLYMGGQWAGAHTSDKPRPSDDDLRARLHSFAADSRDRAKRCREEAAKAGAGPEVVYGVLRWSSRADLASKAATGEFGALVRDGVRVYVQPVD